MKHHTEWCHEASHSMMSCMKHHTVWCHEASHSMMSWSITQYDVMEHHTVCSEYLPYTVEVVTQPTSEDDCILCWGSPSLHKVDGISTSQWRVPREYHTRGLIHTAQLPCTFVWIWHNQARPMNCSLIPRFVCVWTKSLRATVKGGKKKVLVTNLRILRNFLLSFHSKCWQNVFQFQAAY